MKAKRFLTGLLTVAMVLTSLPITAFAEETPESPASVEAVSQSPAEEGQSAEVAAKIGDDEFETLEAAIVAAKEGDTVEVVAAEVELPVNISAENITIEGQGKDKTTLIAPEAGVTISGKNVTLSEVYVDGSAVANYYSGVVNLKEDGAKIINSKLTGGGWDTWNATLYVCLGDDEVATIQNTEISGGFRAIFLGSQSGDVVVEECDLEAIYPISVDGGGEFTLTVNDSYLKGWTSFSAITKADFTDCTFGKGQGYAFMRPYSSTTFTDCEFEEGYEVGGIGSELTYTFTGCTLDGEKLTGKNLSALMDETESSIGTLTVIIDEMPYTYNADTQAWKAGIVAEIDGVKYETLAEAVADAEAGNTVTLLADAEGNGIVIDKDITIDFDGFTYTLADVAVGSANTETNGFQLLADEENGHAPYDVTFKDGTIDVKEEDSDKFAMLIQNYANLTLDNMVLDGTNLNRADKCYTVSNNNGATVIKKGTEILVAGDEDIAFDVSRWSPYESVSVTVKDGAVIRGNVEISAYDEEGFVTTNDNQKLIIEGGKFDGTITELTDVTGLISISGGYFAEKPDAAYLASGLTFVSSNVSGYDWTVGEKKAEAAETVAPAAPAVESDVKVSEGDTVTENAVNDVTAALAPTGGTATAPGITTSAMEAAAATVANDNKVSAETGVAELKEAGVAITPAEGADEASAVTIVVQPYMDIKIADVVAETSTGDNSGGGTPATTITELTLNITPMYQTFATTANIENNEKLVTTADAEADSNKTANAVAIGTAKEMEINATVTVTVPMPASFATDGEQVFVQHKGYEYEGTVASGVLSFENPHGFSEFTFTKSSTAVAKIGADSFTSLQAAMDAASTGDTVTILSADTASVSTTKTVTLTTESETAITVTINGTEYSVVKGTDVEFSYTKPSSRPSGGGGGGSSYAISADKDMENGSVSVKGSAKKGSTVTITVTPEEGYELDTLKVTDRNGKEIDVKDNGDGTFTFVMPEGKVEIDAAFREAGGLPANPAEEDGAIVLTVGNTVATVDGEAVVNDVAPIIRNERTMLPIRFIAEALGAAVAWNDDTDTVTITKEGLVIEIVIGQPYALVNGTPVLLDAPAFIENSRTYLPLRFVAENLGAEVYWDNDTKQVIIVPGE